MYLNPWVHNIALSPPQKNQLSLVIFGDQSAILKTGKWQKRTKRLVIYVHANIVASSTGREESRIERSEMSKLLTQNMDDAVKSSGACLSFTVLIASPELTTIKSFHVNFLCVFTYVFTETKSHIKIY